MVYELHHPCDLSLLPANFFHPCNISLSLQHHILSPRQRQATWYVYGTVNHHFDDFHGFVHGDIQYEPTGVDVVQITMEHPPFSAGASATFCRKTEPRRKSSLPITFLARETPPDRRHGHRFSHLVQQQQEKQLHTKDRQSDCRTYPPITKRLCPAPNYEVSACLYFGYETADL